LVNATANGASADPASVNGISPREEPVRAQPARRMGSTYGEAVDLSGLLGDLPGEPLSSQSKRAGRRRRASRRG
jgi:hypothetical protein